LILKKKILKKSEKRIKTVLKKHFNIKEFTHSNSTEVQSHIILSTNKFRKSIHLQLINKILLSSVIIKSSCKQKEYVEMENSRW